jgi:methyltransferase-like protein
MSQGQNLYDEVPYPGHARPQTHPDRLATLATLFGMMPAPVDGCRYLELGCGDANNLIPMALTLPGSSFVGIDLAPHAIAQGQQLADKLGIKNLRLVHGSIEQVGPDWGKFDYIVAHGFYSWVPPSVRDHALAICRDNLSPQGVAYVSYNALPGCHGRRIVRDVLQFHLGNVTSPREKVQQGTALLKFLAAGQTRPHWFGKFLEQVVEHSSLPGFGVLLIHDDLGEFNDPVYFHQFVKHAAEHGLQFLAEADYHEMQHTIYPPAVAEQLGRMAEQDFLAKEQYLDFLKCRQFRQTLLCHHEVNLDRQVRGEQISAFALASRAEPTSANPNLAAGVVEEFHGPRGGGLQTDHAVAKAALCHLGSVWSQALPFSELVTAACRRLGLVDELPAEERNALAEILLAGCTSGLVEFHIHPAKFPIEVSERPRASALARLQAESGIVTNLRHVMTLLEEPLDRPLLIRLDGTRNRTKLLEELRQLPELTSVNDLEACLDATLIRFARLALLEA